MVQICPKECGQGLQVTDTYTDIFRTPLPQGLQGTGKNGTYSTVKISFFKSVTDQLLDPLSLAPLPPRERGVLQTYGSASAAQPRLCLLQTRSFLQQSQEQGWTHHGQGFSA